MKKEELIEKMVEAKGAEDVAKILLISYKSLIFEMTKEGYHYRFFINTKDGAGEVRSCGYETLAKCVTSFILNDN